MFVDLDPSQAARPFPSWLPIAVHRYHAHITRGLPIRELARRERCCPSTILRQIRRLEQSRDDPLIDDFITALARADGAHGQLCTRHEKPDKDRPNMSTTLRNTAAIDETTLVREARRILRRLCEIDSVLVVSHDRDAAAVFRHRACANPPRIAMVSRNVAQAFAVKDWIRCVATGKVSRYRITEAGRAALRRFLAQDRHHKSCAQGLAEDASPFLAQHADWKVRLSPDAAHRLRVNLAESPLGVLARKKDRAGQPFLSLDLVLAGERLREDFEAAQMGPRIGQNWEKFLTGGDRGGLGHGADLLSGPTAARARVADALGALGPGLGDVALRVCCFLEGLESTEKRMGWSARSGKIVLRIALQRLNQHYADLHGRT